jgi:hypothetical protein
MQNFIFTTNDFKRAMKASFPGFRFRAQSKRLASGRYLMKFQSSPPAPERKEEIDARAKYILDHQEEFASIKNIGSKDRYLLGIKVCNSIRRSPRSKIGIPLGGLCCCQKIILLTCSLKSPIPQRVQSRKLHSLSCLGL